MSAGLPSQPCLGAKTVSFNVGTQDERLQSRCSIALHIVAIPRIITASEKVSPRESAPPPGNGTTGSNSFDVKKFLAFVDAVPSLIDELLSGVANKAARETLKKDVKQKVADGKYEEARNALIELVGALLSPEAIARLKLPKKTKPEVVESSSSDVKKWLDEGKYEKARTALVELVDKLSD